MTLTESLDITNIEELIEKLNEIEFDMYEHGYNLYSSK